MDSKYEIIKKIGSGGMGSVYLCRDVVLDTLRAVKIAVAGSVYEPILRREAELLKMIHDTRIPAVVDMITEADIWIDEVDYSFIGMVMEYVDGCNLMQYINEHGRLSEKQAALYAKELLKILIDLRDRSVGIRYGDIKPENIMIGVDGHIHLVDFSSAYLVGEHPIMHTPGFSPPGIAGEKMSDVEEDSYDTYGVGMLLNMMVTKNDPRQYGIHMPKPTWMNREISREFERIVLKATSLDKEKRYLDARHMLQELSQSPLRERNKKRMIHILDMSSLLCLGAALMGILLPYWDLDLHYFSEAMSRECASVTICLGMAGLLCRVIARIFKKDVGEGIFIRQNRLYAAANIMKMPIAILAVCIATSLLLGGNSSQAKESDMQAFSTILRDREGRRILIKEGNTYSCHDNLYIEIPWQEIPDSDTVLEVSITDQDTLNHKKRTYLIKADAFQTVGKGVY